MSRIIVITALGATGALGVGEFIKRQEALAAAPAFTLPAVGSQTTQTTQTTSQGSATQSQTGTQTQTQTQSQPPAGYVLVAPLSALSGRSYAYFNHPKFGSSILVNYNGTWNAFSSSCTHAGCTVNLTGSSVYCPCHSGYFSPANGAVTGGPPPTPLPQYDVKIISGNLYVGSTIIN